MKTNEPSGYVDSESLAVLHLLNYLHEWFEPETSEPDEDLRSMRVLK